MSPGFLAFAGSVLGVIIVGIFQKPVEVEIQPPRETLPLQNVLGLNQDAFSHFPIQWRQVLASIALQPNSYHPITVKILSSITPTTGDFIRTLAARVIDGRYMVRDNTVSTRHDFVPQKLFSEFLDLEALGFLQAADTGLEVTMRTEDPKGKIYFRIIATTNHRILVLNKDKKLKLRLPVTTLTAAGREIVDLLREPTNINYIKWLADQIRERGFDVTVWSNWSTTGGANKYLTTQLGFPVHIDKDLKTFDQLPGYLLDRGESRENSTDR